MPYPTFLDLPRHIQADILRRAAIPTRYPLTPMGTYGRLLALGSTSRDLMAATDYDRDDALEMDASRRMARLACDVGGSPGLAALLERTAPDRAEAAGAPRIGDTLRRMGRPFGLPTSPSLAMLATEGMRTARASGVPGLADELEHALTVRRAGALRSARVQVEREAERAREWEAEGGSDDAAGPDEPDLRPSVLLERASAVPLGAGPSWRPPRPPPRLPSSTLEALGRLMRRVEAEFEAAGRA